MNQLKLFKRRQRKETKRNLKRKTLRRQLNVKKGSYRLDEQRLYLKAVFESKLANGEIRVVGGKVEMVPPEQQYDERLKQIQFKADQKRRSIRIQKAKKILYNFD